jgi:putative RecB family exonuclease
MTLPAWRTERDDAAAPPGAPYLSHSRISKYLTCPEQYRLYYLEHLRPVVPSASLVFGSLIHQALAHFFAKKGDPVKCFLDAWNVLKELKLDYSRNETWEKLKVSGEALLRKFLADEAPKFSNVRAVEKRFSLSITSLDLPLVGVLDLAADVEGKSTVVDFKTSGSRYDEYEAPLSDQLSAYHLAEPIAEQVAFCVLVKTKEPKIEWHVTRRNGDQLAEYLIKAGFVARDIAAGRFFPVSGKHCSWCDYLPVCLGNKRKAAETLFKIT